MNYLEETLKKRRMFWQSAEAEQRENVEKARERLKAATGIERTAAQTALLYEVRRLVRMEGK